MASDEELRKIQQFLVQYQSGLFSSGAAYTNLITIGGYAGGFTMWSFVKDHLSVRAGLAVAIFLGISLICFVTWNVHQMIWLHIQRMKYVTALAGLSGQDFINKNNELEEQTRAAAFGWIMKAWLVMLVVTIGSGYIAFLILFFNCSEALLGTYS